MTRFQRNLLKIPIVPIRIVIVLFAYLCIIIGRVGEIIYDNIDEYLPGLDR